MTWTALTPAGTIVARWTMTGASGLWQCFILWSESYRLNLILTIPQAIHLGFCVFRTHIVLYQVSHKVRKPCLLRAQCALDPTLVLLLHPPLILAMLLLRRNCYHREANGPSPAGP